MTLKEIQKILRPVLYPFAIIYGLGSSLRNLFFDFGWLKSVSFDPAIIVVGNLTAGGTGKTPFVRYILKHVQEGNKLGVLSRGYKRKSKGFVLADNDTTPEEIGDEPMMYHYNHGEKVAVAVCEDRVLAIPRIISERETNAIILDDAYQHRYVKPKFNILITDYGNLFTKDFILPAGLLRESRRGAKRSDFVIVSKCPEDISTAEMERIQHTVNKYASHEHIAFTKIKYLNEVGASLGSSPIITFSGIAQNEQFQNSLRAKHNVLATLSFPDHYWYTQSDIEELKKEYERLKKESPVIVTTEKDFMRLQSPQLKEMIEGLPLCYIPIEVEFIKGEDLFLKELKKVVVQSA